MSKLSSSIISVDEIGGEQQFELFELFSTYYDDVTFDRFCKDLESKDGLFLLQDERGKLRGFSSFAIGNHQIDGQPIQTIFSGDTIIDHRYWGEQALAFSWLEQAGRIKKLAGDMPLYWFLIVKGYRTYKYLPTFAREFYPTFRNKTPTCEKSIMDHLAKERFGSCYSAATGIVHFKTPVGRLKKNWLDPTADKPLSPDVAFFFDKNPGHDRGDELVCLAEISERNMPPLAARIFRKGFQ